MIELLTWHQAVVTTSQIIASYCCYCVVLLLCVATGDEYSRGRLQDAVNSEVDGLPGAEH
jgi:hypothetical protein